MICLVDGCHAAVHGNGLCRIHFDRRRYAETTGQDPEIAAAASRERWIRWELRFGNVPEWASETRSLFTSDGERREAWKTHREELLRQDMAQPSAGQRPAAWWEYEAGRPEYLTHVAYGSQDLATSTRESHEREVEKFTFLARHGHLTDPELEHIENRAAIARARIGTTAEHVAANSPDYGADKLTVAIAEAVKAGTAA
jgi:hypothetical protein